MVAAVGAAVWVSTAGGSFGTRFGALLALTGLAMAISGGSGFTRGLTVEPNVFFGKGPDEPYREPNDGRTGLTALGLFLFVSLPLIVVGVWLAGIG